MRRTESEKAKKAVYEAWLSLPRADRTFVLLEMGSTYGNDVALHFADIFRKMDYRKRVKPKEGNICLCCGSPRPSEEDIAEHEDLVRMADEYEKAEYEELMRLADEYDKAEYEKLMRKADEF